MKITATSRFNALASAAYRTYRWRVYYREVTDVSLSLASGTWTEITSRIPLEDLPDISARIEHELGQFTTDSLELKASGVSYFKTSIFTSSFLTTATKYGEVAIYFTLDGASDSVPMFYGFVDKNTIVYNELADSVTFSLFTSQDLGTRIAAENLTTQYVETDIDGSGTDGLILQYIPGMFLKDANKASYVLKLGEHVIEYEDDTQVKHARLDGGRWVPITANGTYTLGNAEDAADDTERLDVHVPDIFDLGAYGTTYTDYVVVITEGTVLPRQWYRNVSARTLLKRMYEAIGITSVTFDAMEMNTYDGSKKVSWLDAPPNDSTVSGTKRAMETDGTDLFFGVGNKVYKRTMSTDTYTLVTTLDSGDLIERIIYHKRVGNHEDLWIYHTNGSTVKLTCYELDTSTKRTTATLTTAGTDAVGKLSLAVVDYNYTGSSYLYALCYSVKHTASDRGFFKTATKSGGSSLTLTTVFSALVDTGANDTGYRSAFTYVKSGNLVRTLALYDVSPPALGYEEMTINVSGTWVQNGAVFINANLVEQESFIVYNASEDRVYYYTSTAPGIKSHPGGSYSSSVNHTFDAGGEDMGSMTYYDGVVYYTTNRFSMVAELPSQKYFLWSVTGNPASPTELATGVWAVGIMLAHSSTRLYGLSENSLLFQYHTALAFYVSRARFNAESVTTSLYKVLQAFNLIATIGSTKAAFVYRRGDASGTPQTSGQSIAINITNASNLTEEVYRYLKAELIRVAGASVTETYDGTKFGVSVLSDKRTIEISNDIIPDELVKHLCYHVYQFFKTSRSVYIVPVDAARFQYEPFDGAVLTFTSTKIQKSATGLIYACTYTRTGQMLQEIMI